MTMFPKIDGIYALLDDCPTRCAVHAFRENLYVNTGPLIRLLTPQDDGSFLDDGNRRWTIVGPLAERAAVVQPVYRFLVEGDIVKATDEFVSNDGWQPPDDWVVGMEYPSRVFKPCRRRVSALPCQACILLSEAVRMAEAEGFLSVEDLTSIAALMPLPSAPL